MNLTHLVTPAGECLAIFAADSFRPGALALAAEQQRLRFEEVLGAVSAAHGVADTDGEALRAIVQAGLPALARSFSILAAVRVETARAEAEQAGATVQ